MNKLLNHSAIIFIFIVSVTMLLSGCLFENEKIETEGQKTSSTARPVITEDKQTAVTRKTQVRGSDEIKSIQSALDELGYDPGPIDGIMGAKTREAIKLYQQDHDLPVTGELSSDSKKILIGE